jgi:hypothetical protein
MSRHWPELRIPLDRLPDDPAAREHVLQEYFAERVPDHSVTASSHEHHGVLVSVPPVADYYIDPRLQEGLSWWGPSCSVADIPYAYRRDRGTFIAMSDAWTLLAWSEWMERTGTRPERVTVIHLDDHDDLMSPRLVLAADGFIDLLTGKSVQLDAPDSIRGAVQSGAVGMGSFFAPLVHTVPVVDIRHLCDTSYSQSRIGTYALKRAVMPDTLLRPGRARPAVQLVQDSAMAMSSDQSAGQYRVDTDEAALLADVTDDPILLHIDLDFFNNRFNGDSDWQNHSPRHDPAERAVADRIDQVLAALAPLHDRIVDVSIGISPGFFPAELWEPACDALLAGLDVRT